MDANPNLNWQFISINLWYGPVRLGFLAKVGVEGSNPFTRSNFQEKGPWTVVQVTVSDQLMFRKKSLWSDSAGKVAGKRV